MENKEKNNFLSIKKAADMIGLHQYTLRDWIKKYELIKKKNLNELTESDKIFRCPTYARIGNRYRFKKEDIEKFIEESTNN